MRVLCADVRLEGKPHHDWKEGYELMYAFRNLGIQCDVAGPHGWKYTELDIPRIAPFYDLIVVTENYPFTQTDTVPRGWRWWDWGRISTRKVFWAFDTHIHNYKPIIEVGRFHYAAFAIKRSKEEYGIPNSFVLHYALSKVHHWYPEVLPKEYECIFLGNLIVSPRRKYLCDKFGIQHMKAFGADYFRTMKKAKICFNNSMSDDINAKYFEIMGSGSFMLTNYNQEIIDFFDKSVEQDLRACMYTTEEDIGEKINYYLEHEEEREAIAKRLFDYVWTNHTWESRGMEILRFVQK
jgi:hypothetical protein